MFEDLYKNVFGRAVARVLASPVFSYAAGKFLDSRPSRFLIKPFIMKNGIDLMDVEDWEFSCFNAFFTRRLVDGARPVDADEAALVSPCDGLLTVLPVTENGLITVKGTPYTVSELLDDEAASRAYVGGSCLVFRLTPKHYHRYCFPCDGTAGENRHINGIYHTVRPLALTYTPVFKTNTREWTKLHTGFGDLIQMEVGALLVGRIVNDVKSGAFVKGMEKGRFEFGGSTIILLLPAGSAVIKDEFVNADDEIEVRQGERLNQ